MYDILFFCSNLVISFAKGLILGSSVLFVSLACDHILSPNSTRVIIKENSSLYDMAIIKNVQNLLVISPIIYSFIDNSLLKHTISFSFTHYFGLLLTHNILYWFGHREIHRNKFLYIRIHKFHHMFDKLLTPSIGNAVSNIEFILLYVSPFCIGAFFFKPNEITFLFSIATISILNMIIHTSEFKDVNWFPLMVSPKNHHDHHLERDCHYAAPLLNIDEIQKSISLIPSLTEPENEIVDYTNQKNPNDEYTYKQYSHSGYNPNYEYHEMLSFTPENDISDVSVNELQKRMETSIDWSLISDSEYDN